MHELTLTLMRLKPSGHHDVRLHGPAPKSWLSSSLLNFFVLESQTLIQIAFNLKHQIKRGLQNMALFCKPETHGAARTADNIRQQSRRYQSKSSRIQISTWLEFRSESRITNKLTSRFHRIKCWNNKSRNYTNIKLKYCLIELPTFMLRYFFNMAIKSTFCVHCMIWKRFPCSRCRQLLTI